MIERFQHCQEFSGSRTARGEERVHGEETEAVAEEEPE
jgi:hypothetical protein